MSQATARLLAALELLQAQRRVTGAELAERLQVDRRTARRYVARLLAMGVPIVGDRGRDGAYRLTAGYKLPPLMFNDDEALALSIGLVAARGLGLGQARVAADSALAKLERVMPEALRSRMRAVAGAVQLDVRGHRTAAPAQALALLSEAVHRQQRLRLRYRAGAPADDEMGGVSTERLFDPWGLTFYLGHWYAVGHCHLRGAQRSFRLDRIESLQPVAASFAPPAGFDALQAMRHAVATLPRRHTVQVTLHASQEQARACVPAELGTLVPLRGRGTPRLRLVSLVDDLEWFARELAGLPFRFEIRRPPALAAAVRSLATRLQQGARLAVASRRPDA